MSIATDKGPLTFGRLQSEQRDWSEYNFGAGPEHDGVGTLLGVVEEVGELSHAVLKARQGIRGNPQELKAQEKDAVGDIIIYLADFCNRRGHSLQCVVEDAWAEVRNRDWRRFPKNGTSE